MLGCKISKGVSAACETNVSGVKRIAIANWGEGYTFTPSTGSCEVDTISLGDEKFYNIAFTDGSASAVSTLTTGATKDMKYFVETITFSLAKLDCDLLEQYVDMALAQLIVAVETKNGDVYVFGTENGLSASAMEYTTGAGEGDAAGVAVTLDGTQPIAPIKVTDWSVISALF